MAKKTVATFRGKGVANLVKVIVPIKNEKTGAYAFKEEMVPQAELKDFLAKHGG